MNFPKLLHDFPLESFFPSFKRELQFLIIDKLSSTISCLQDEYRGEIEIGWEYAPGGWVAGIPHSWRVANCWRWQNPAEEYHGLGKLCMVMRQSKNSKWEEQEKQGQITAEWKQTFVCMCFLVWFKVIWWFGYEGEKWMVSWMWIYTNMTWNPKGMNSKLYVALWNMLLLIQTLLIAYQKSLPAANSVYLHRDQAMFLSHNCNAVSFKLNPLSLSCFIHRKVIEHCSNFKEENMDTSR